MKRRYWALLALLSGIVAVALIAVPRFSGGTQSVRTHEVSVGDTYVIAVCLQDSQAAPNGEPAGIQFNLVYDDTLNQCVPDTDCTTNSDTSDPLCRDSNPDLNAGITTFSTPGLGSGYNCASTSDLTPSCDRDTATGPGHGVAFLACFTTQTPTLNVGDQINAPLAEIQMHAVGGSGTGAADNLTLDDAHLFNPSNAPLINCPGGPGSCVGATDTKFGNTPVPQPTATNTPATAPTSTPVCSFAGELGLPTCTPTSYPKTFTPTPGPTETPPAGGGGGGGGGEPTQPPSGGPGGAVTPPATGEGSGGTPWSAVLLWSIFGVGTASIFTGTFYLRRAQTRR